MTLSNNPPDMTVTAAETTQSISEWMAENPVITSQEQAKEAKVYLDRGKLCVSDLEDERKKKVKPFNEQVETINDHYRGPRELLSQVNAALVFRIGAFIKAETERREAIAAEAEAKRLEAERIAREAEAKEKEALDNASKGELGINTAEVIQAADEKFAEYEAAQRIADLAKRETTVKITGGFTRAMGLRAKEELIVVDGAAAISDIGITDDIREAILKCARAYRRIHGELPSGVVKKT